MSQRVTGWVLALLCAQGGVGPLGNPPVWNEVIEIRERDGCGVSRIVKNDPGSVFDTVTDAECDYFEMSADDFRARWFDALA